MIDRFDVTLPALTGDRPRKAYVYLPVGYDGERRYPVMYMFDGQNLFSDEEATYGKCWGLADYLDFTQTPLIVAAVECDTRGDNRLSEYSPVTFSMRDGRVIKGKGKKYMDWLVKSFKPYIDENYATLPGRANTAIGGSSMGGLMTLYAVSRYNGYFFGGAALSPSIWVEGGAVLTCLTKAKFRKNTVLYMDYGSKELKNHPGIRQAFAQTGAFLTESGVHVTSRIVPGGFHSEASWERQIPFFMNVLGFVPED